MKIIQNYQSFFEGLFSRKIETQYFYSERLRSIFSRVEESYISFGGPLVYGENTNQVTDDITLFDIGEDDSTITFIQTNRLQKMKEEEGDNDDFTYWLKSKWRTTHIDLNFKGWKEQRTSIGIGKFITRLFKQAGISIKDADKESLVNSYKSFYKQAANIEERFELVKGEDIRKWYLEDRYQFQSGELSNSCMRYPRCQSYLDIYVKNPEVCSLLILKGTEPDKIIGRALVWKLSKPEGVTYMDRVYTNYPSDKNVFMNYAKKMDWYQLGLHNPIRSPYQIQLGSYEYDLFPYMDSFGSYNSRTHILTDDEDVLVTKEWYELKDTKGGFTSGDRVYSEYHGEYINRDDAVYCDDVNDWLRTDEARYLEYKGVYVSPDNEDVVYSEYHGGNYFTDDTVYCEYLDDYLYIESSVDAFINPDDTEWFPDDFLKKGIIDIIDISSFKNVVVLSNAVMIDPFTNKWVYKKQSVILYWSDDLKDFVTEEESQQKGLTLNKQKESSEWYSEYLTRKIGEVNPDVLFNYLKELKPTTQELKRVTDYFNGIYHLSGNRRFTDEDKFELVKLALFIMVPDKKRNYSFKNKIVPGLVRDVCDDNKEKAKNFLGDELFAKYELNINEFHHFMNYASTHAMSLIKDEEALKTYIGLKLSSKTD